MSKYIHVDGNDGSMVVGPTQQVKGPGLGWVYKVPDDYSIVLGLEELGNYTYIHELFHDDADAELVQSDT